MFGDIEGATLLFFNLNYFLMPNTENETQHENSVHEFQHELAVWLDSFDERLKSLPKSQQLIHDCLQSLDHEMGCEKQRQVISAFLNSVLSLTFLLKDHPEQAEKFIKYNTF